MVLFREWATGILSQNQHLSTIMSVQRKGLRNQPKDATYPTMATILSIAHWCLRDKKGKQWGGGGHAGVAGSDVMMTEGQCYRICQKNNLWFNSSHLDF